MLTDKPDTQNASREELITLFDLVWQELTSLRQQVEQVNLENGRLKQQNTLLIQAVEAFQEQHNKPKKTSDNSSLPPSTDLKANVPTSSKPRSQAPTRHHQGGRRLHPNPTVFTDLKPEQCSHCGHPIADVDLKVYARFDHYEIPKIEPIITRVTRHQCCCPNCNKVTTAECPSDLRQDMTYGSNLSVFLFYLHYFNIISYERLTDLMVGMFDVKVSEGSIAKVFKGYREKLKMVEGEILTAVRSAKYVYSDETSARVNGIKNWEWVFATDLAYYHKICGSRSANLIKEIWTEAILKQNQPVVWISDLFSAQLKNPAKQHQICLAHQIRDCKYVIAQKDTEFAPKMLDFFGRVVDLHHRKSEFKASTMYQYRLRLRRELDELLEKPVAHPDGENLRRRYQEHRDRLLVCLEYEGIEPTNNRSEQALRPSVIFRKVTNGMRSDWGAEVFSVLRSVMSTGRLYGWRPLEALRRALFMPSFLPTQPPGG
jgi:transposase